MVVSHVLGSDNRVLARNSETKWRTSISQSQSESPGSPSSFVIVGDYNYRLSRTRRTIENAFGILILGAKWRIFRRAIRADVTLVEKIVQATICLHNYLCLTENANYTPAGFVDCDSSGNIISSAASNPNFSALLSGYSSL